MVGVIVSIVEGQAEVEALPVLVRRVLADLGAAGVGVARPFRVRRNRIVRAGELERALVQSARARPRAGAFLVVVDADDDCPVGLGNELLRRSRQATQLPVSVVLAQREFEAWFLGAKESLRGVRGIRDDAVAPDHPESIRGAKERLTANMAQGSYVEVDDQPALAARMDFALARGRCPSFAKLWREIESLAARLA
jgi:Domain of unknown function (DUF4276)